MFLTKKNPTSLHKPKNIESNKHRKALAGWDDEEDDKDTQPVNSNYKNEQKSSQLALNLLDQNPKLMSKKSSSESQTIKSSEKQYFDWQQLNNRNDIECEKKLVEQIVQPGGIRIKPNDNMLAEFVKQVKGMDANIIGSLLLSKIEVNYSFQVKAKALYTIEHLIKKNNEYMGYFKSQSEKLRQFPEPEDNVENYRKILKSVQGMIGSNHKIVVQEPKIVFVDPGYNEDSQKNAQLHKFLNLEKEKEKEKEKDKSPVLKGKKQIIGPNQIKIQNKGEPHKNTAQIDLLGDFGVQIEAQKGNLVKQNSINLLGDNLTNQSPLQQLKFDDILRKTKTKNDTQLLGGFHF